MLLALLSVATAQQEAAVELSRSVPLVSAEGVGMGSAGLAWASGAKGMFAHPAAPAMRPVESRAHVTGTVTANISTFSQLTGIGAQDFGLPKDAWQGGIANFGGTLLVNNGGGGVVLSTARYSSGDREIRSKETHYLGAWSWTDGNVVFGVGYRTATARLSTPTLDVTYRGRRGFETGVVLCAGGWNLALLWRSRIEASPRIAGDDIPSIAVLPAEFSVGGSWVGLDPVTGLPARLAIDLVALGAVEGGVSVEGLAMGLDVAKGQEITMSPRVGGELEILPDRLKIRTGSWYEPARSALVPGRLHGTAGFEVKLFSVPWIAGRELPLSVDWAVDGARGYRNVAWVGFGTWRSGRTGPWIGPRE